MEAMLAWTAGEWSEVIAAAGGVLGAIGYLGRLYLRAGYVTKAELGDAHKQLTGLTRRTETLEAQLHRMATSDDVNDVLLAVEKTNGDWRALKEEVAGLRQLLASIEKPLLLMQQHLLQDSK
jgi:hypothetical protein